MLFYRIPFAIFLCLFLTCWQTVLADVPAFNVLDKNEVTQMYRTYFCPADYIDPAWNGRVVTGTAGSINPQFIDATVDRLNFMRALAGLPGDVTANSQLSTQAQRVALMLAEKPQKIVSMLHDPLRGGTDTLTDNSAGRFFFPEAVNLMKQGTSSYRGTAAEAIYNSIVSDLNGAVFVPADDHAYPFKRQILLSPALQSIGVGTVQPRSWVLNELGRSTGRSFDGAMGSITTKSSSNQSLYDKAILWPPAGSIPYVFIDENWSASLPGADMRQATVRVTGPDGQILPVRYLRPEQWESLNHQPGEKYIDTVAWQISEGGVFDHNTRQYIEKPVPFGQPYLEFDIHVSIQNILLNGSYTSLNYTVHQYNPHGSMKSHRMLVDFTPPTTTVPDSFAARVRMYSEHGCLIRLPKESFKLFGPYPEVSQDDIYRALYLRSIDNNGSKTLGSAVIGNIDGHTYSGVVLVLKSDAQGQYRFIHADKNVEAKPYLPGQFEVESETLVFSPSEGLRYENSSFLPEINDTFIPEGGNNSQGGINQNNNGAQISTEGPMCSAKQKKKCKRRCKKKKRRNPKVKKRRCVKRCQKRKCN